MEKAAFTVCESDGADGLTWLEVEKCEVRGLGAWGWKFAFLLITCFQAHFANSGVPLPTFADFMMFDLNSDGILFLGEWEEKTGC